MKTKQFEALAKRNNWDLSYNRRSVYNQENHKEPSYLETINHGIKCYEHLLKGDEAPIIILCRPEDESGLFLHASTDCWDVSSVKEAVEEAAQEWFLNSAWYDDKLVEDEL